MRKVTYKTFAKVKEGRKLVEKTYTHVEYTEADDTAIRIRILAFNGQLVSVEPVIKRGGIK